MSDLALAALARKRAELDGEIMALGQRIERLRADLAHLDAALLIMDPAADPEAIRPKRPPGKSSGWFGRGELQRLALDTIRTAGAPVGCREIAKAVMGRRGLDAGDGKAVRRVRNMVSCALRRGEDRRLVRRVAAGGGRVGWVVAA